MSENLAGAETSTILAAGSASPAVADAVTLPRHGFFDRDWSKALVFFLTVLAGLALLWVVWMIISPILHILILFGLAGVLAFALAKPVDMLATQIGNRTISIVVVYLFVAVLAVGGITLLAGPFVGQATALATDLPNYANDLQGRAPQVEGVLNQYGIATDLDTIRTRVVSAVEQGGTEVLTNLVGKVSEILGVLLDTVLALVISLYLLVDGPRIRARVLAAVPEEHRGKVLFLEDNVSRVLGGYLRGQLTLALIIGVAAGVGTGLLGVRYAVVLGVLAGLFELVPMFGPILSAVPAVIVALFSPFPTVIWVILFFLAVQQVENNVLAPRISGHAVGLHPLAAMFALLTGFQLAGVLGGLFAVPIAGVVWVLLAAAYHNAVAEVETPRRPRGWTLPPLRRRIRPNAPRPPAERAA